MNELARANAKAHLRRALGQPRASRQIDIVDPLQDRDVRSARSRARLEVAPWIIEIGSAVAPRCLERATVTIERGSDHVRVRIAEDLVGWIADHLGLAFDGVRDDLGRPIGGPSADWGRPWVDLVTTSLRLSIRAVASALGARWAELEPWPGGRPYALTLSHDIDSLYEREPFALVHNLVSVRSPERDMLRSRNVALRRLTRSVLRPIDPLRSIGRLLAVESELSIIATYFVLLDDRWSRHGARYELGQPAVRDMLAMVLAAGHEVGLHTGVSYFRDREALAGWAGRLRATGASVESSRGHYLCFEPESGPSMLAAAGIHNDATYGLSHSTGYRAGTGMPFALGEEASSVVEVPLGLMDVALFGEGGDPFSRAMRMLDDVRGANGLLSVLWHNSYAARPEYAHVEDLACRLLQQAHADGAWMASTAQVRNWFDDRDATEVRLSPTGFVATARGTHPVAMRVTEGSGTRTVVLEPGATEEIAIDSWSGART